MERSWLDNRVRSRRKAVGGLTQAELAALAGVTRQTIVAIEHGKHAPSVALALKLASALSCQVEDLFVLRQEAPEAPIPGPD
ncbi:MAG: helix-turn-helix domain-containing protein [Candidatus Krumholzibacteriia bacterium]